ncbi:MAG: helix-turn-helix domain-containing protein [Bacteroidota bacterium]|nr:helix-turn-helix domain-containing protein [Bacteroidota bacterium]
MEQVIRLEKISEYNVLKQTETLHPLVSVIDNSNQIPLPNGKYHFGFYAVFLKETVCGELGYGRNKYDYEEGTLVFIAPGQVISVNHDDNTKPHKGLTLIFHPDLINGTPLAQNINKYHFFSYEANEALHISQREKKMIYDLFEQIQFELSQSIDKHSKKLISFNIELLLSYCERFYDRQFITRERLNQGAMELFEKELNNYFNSEKPQALGLPSVAYFADILHLSPNYFGDLVKKESGKTALEYIHFKIMNIAKDRILDDSKTISQIADELGFKYPQHFTRLFKRSVGVSPSEFRNLN